MTTFKLIGRGPSKVLLFPGLLGTHDAFDDMLRYADLDAFQYVVFEYRGYGQARDEAGLFTLHEAVIDAVRVVEFLGWTKLAVVGHSLGALVAQMLAVAFPNRIEAIVSIAGLSAKGASADPERRSFMQQLAHSLEKREALVKSGTAGRYMPGVTRALAASTWPEIDGNALARMRTTRAGPTFMSKSVRSTRPFWFWWESMPLTARRLLRAIRPYAGTGTQHCRSCAVPVTIRCSRLPLRRSVHLSSMSPAYGTARLGYLLPSVLRSHSVTRHGPVERVRYPSTVLPQAPYADTLPTARLLLAFVLR